MRFRLISDAYNRLSSGAPPLVGSQNPAHVDACTDEICLTELMLVKRQSGCKWQNSCVQGRSGLSGLAAQVSIKRVACRLW